MFFTGSASAGSTAVSRCRTSSAMLWRRRGSRWSSSSRSRINWYRSMRRLKSRRKRPPDISRLRACRIQASDPAPKAVPSASEAAALLSADAVRARCAIVSEAVQRRETRYFRLVPGQLDEAVRRVVDVTRRRYPDLAVPHHSRWRHFSTGGVDRAALVARGADAAETARARIDL